MRITGGIYRGRTVQCPPGVIRPAMDRMRESMFSILGSLEGSSFLDLFSGSGAVGIEAASRGASPVVLVEKDRKKRAVISKNISMVQSEISLVMMGVEAFFRRGMGSYDVVHFDPPFSMKNKASLLEDIDRSTLLKENSIVMIHYPREEKLPKDLEKLTLYDEREYGGSALRFYRRKW